EIIDRRVARYGRGACLGLDLDFRDMAAVRIAHAVCSRRIGIERMRRRAGECAGQLDESDGAVPGVKPAFAVAELVLRCGQPLRRVRPGELDQLVTKNVKRAAGPQCTARAPGAVADQVRGGRARMEAYVSGIYTEPLADDLRKGRFMALAGRVGDGEERHA